jgi:hypothetical protein
MRENLSAKMQQFAYAMRHRHRIVKTSCGNVDLAMTFLHQLRRTAHRTLLALGVVMLVSSGMAVGSDAMSAHAHAAPTTQEGHCPSSNEGGTEGKGHNVPASLPECCQQDCQCPLAGGGVSLWIPVQAASQSVPYLAAADFPPVPLLASQHPQDLLRPPI